MSQLASRRTYVSHQYETTVTTDGRIEIFGVPVKAGQRVEIIVIPHDDVNPVEAEKVRQRLSGSILRDDDPYGPATPPEDWDAMR